MHIRRYTGPTLQEVLQRVHRELGPHVAIIDTRKTQEGGFFGLMGRAVVEVTVGVDWDGADPADAARSGAGRGEGRAADAEGDVGSGAGDDLAGESGPRVRLPGGSPAPSPVAGRIGRGAAAVARRAGTARPGAGRGEPAAGPGGWTPGPAWDLPVPADPRAGSTTGAGRSARVRGGTDDTLIAARRELNDLRVKPRGAPESSAAPAGAPMAEELERMHRVLVRNQVESDIARSILRVFDEQLALLGEDWATAQPRFERYLAGLIRTAPGIKLTGARRPVVAMFIGPTGVGKTTSIAKIASHFALREHRKVALVTADTYRMAATDQLRRFGQILGIPVHVADSAPEMEQVMVKLGGHDLVLVDTAGRSPQHKEHMRQMRELVDAARPDEIHLVMSLTTKYVDVLQIVARFGIVPANRVIWTKADETRSYGIMLNLSMKFMMDVSYLTTGQEVPDDLEAADPVRLAKLVTAGPAGTETNGRSGRPA